MKMSNCCQRFSLSWGPGGEGRDEGEPLSDFHFRSRGQGEEGAVRFQEWLFWSVDLVFFGRCERRNILFKLTASGQIPPDKGPIVWFTLEARHVPLNKSNRTD